MPMSFGQVGVSFFWGPIPPPTAKENGGIFLLIFLASHTEMGVPLTQKTTHTEPYVAHMLDTSDRCL